MDKDLQIKFASLEDEVKKVIRRVDTMQKSIDLLYADREILEDIQGSIKHLQEIILANQHHQELKSDNVKSEIKDVQTAIEHKMDEKTILIDDKKKGFGKIKQLFKKEGR